MNIADRISPLTILLDEVFYKSAIEDMRRSFFFATKTEQIWWLLSDYYFGDEKPNKVITFSAMPFCPYIPELQDTIKAVAPKDIKNTRSINANFVKLINLLPLMNVIFVFENDKHFIWDTTAEAKAAILDHIEILRAYVAYWRTNEPANIPRLERIAKNLRDLENLLKRNKKLRIISAMFLVALLGGYVASIICRETDLSTLAWLSDRDSTNEIGNNLIRDLFQITLIDVIKKNISFNFTTSNSGSEEWYKEVTRIPDYLTGAAAGFDFNGRQPVDQKTTQMLGLHFSNNRKNTFLFRFNTDGERIRLQRMLITNKDDRTEKADL